MNIRSVKIFTTLVVVGLLVFMFTTKGTHSGVEKFMGLKANVTSAHSNKPTSLKQTLAKDRKKLILFSSTSCPTCKQQYKELMSLAYRGQLNDFEIVTIYSSNSEVSKDEASVHFADKVVLDRYEDFASKVRARYTPEIFVVDGSENLVFRHRGLISGDSIISRLEKHNVIGNT